MILSLFSGCGGLDLGFEAVGYETGLAFDLRPSAVASWNRNRSGRTRAYVADIRELTVSAMDSAYGAQFAPVGVIGGPPCQSFTRANHYRRDDDPRAVLVRRFFTLALRLHRNRKPLDFIVMENVRELEQAQAGRLLRREVKRLELEGFLVFNLHLNARDFSVPQNRHRLFIVAINKVRLAPAGFSPPQPCSETLTVRDAIDGLPEPIYFCDAGNSSAFPQHPNHWCMTPQSPRFFDGSLKSGQWSSRSFKTLSWDQPSIAVSYGHREVHVHPDGRRRLSVFEAMRLQGFPDSFVLEGTLSAQIDQISEAVPPPLARAVALSVAASVRSASSAVVYATPASSRSPESVAAG